MDKRTRVLNALNKKPVDHVPVGFWFHFAGEETVGENFIKAQMAYYKDVDMDFIKATDIFICLFPSKLKRLLIGTI